MSDRPSSARASLGATGALLALAAISWGLSHHPLGMWAAPAALTIATLKALIVATVFIGLHRQPSSNRLVLLAAVTLLITLVGFMAVDVLRR